MYNNKNTVKQSQNQLNKTNLTYQQNTNFEM